MNIIEKLILLIKNIFKKGEIKKIEAPKQTQKEDKKSEFIDSLKIQTNIIKKKKKIETLVCPGDGLGIQNKITS